MWLATRCTCGWRGPRAPRRSARSVRPGCTIYDHRDREWRHLDVPAADPAPCARAARGLPDAWRAADCRPVGGPGLEVHAAVRAAGDRLAARGGGDGGGAAAQARLGCRLGIERRAVARGLERRGTLMLRYVGVDEKSFQRLHDYLRNRGERSRGRPRALRGRRPQAGEPGGLLGTGTDRGPARRDRGDRDAHDGSRMSRRHAPRSRPPRTRSSSIASTAPSISTRASIACVAPSTAS